MLIIKDQINLKGSRTKINFVIYLAKAKKGALNTDGLQTRQRVRHFALNPSIVRTPINKLENECD